MLQKNIQVFKLDEVTDLNNDTLGFAIHHEVSNYHYLMTYLKLSNHTKVRILCAVIISIIRIGSFYINSRVQKYKLRSFSVMAAYLAANFFIEFRRFRLLPCLLQQCSILLHCNTLCSYTSYKFTFKF